MKLLHIDSSVLGANSASRELSAAIVAIELARAPRTTVTYRDLAADPLAHFSAQVLSARMDAASAQTQATSVREDIAAGERAIAEFLDADTLVIGAPMYNFSVPSQLKAWIDRIAVAGRTFRYTATGPEGLSSGKRVIVASSRGGAYSTGPAAAMDHQESYLRSVFGLLGVSDMRFIRAEGLHLGADQRAAAMAAAHREIDLALPLAA